MPRWLKDENERLDKEEKEKRAEIKRKLDESQARAAEEEREKASKKRRGEGSEPGSSRCGDDSSGSDDDEDDEDSSDDEEDEDDHTTSKSASFGKKPKQARKLKSVLYTSKAFVAIRDDKNKVIAAKCCVGLSDGKTCGQVIGCENSSPSMCWAHLKKCHGLHHTELQEARVSRPTQKPCVCVICTFLPPPFIQCSFPEFQHPFDSEERSFQITRRCHLQQPAVALQRQHQGFLQICPSCLPGRRSLRLTVRLSIGWSILRILSLRRAVPLSMT